nr:prolipoprotein diacylglyceryl transferase [Kiritimatiellia bacterium]
SDLALWIMLGGVLGARLAFVAAHWPEFRGAPLSIFALHEGGLIYYGGLAGGILAVLIFAWVRREPIWSLGDFVVSAIPLAHAIGRIGCFTRGCCYGAVCTTSGWAVEIGGALRYPVQLYEAAANVALYVVLLPIVLRRRGRPGIAVATYMTLYGCIRFGTELLRGDERQRLGALGIAQWISLGLIAAGVTIFFARSRKTTRAKPA